MPFWLKTAPATFQPTVDVMPSRVRWKTALLYLHEVIIYSGTVTEHLTHAREVPQLFHTEEVTMKLAKCTVFDTAMFYLGHTVCPGQLQVGERSLVANERAVAPTNQTDLRSCLGICNVHGRIVPDPAKNAAPLSKKSGKEEPFEFELLTNTEFDVSRELKKKQVSPSILALPCHGYRCILDTDVYENQVGCALQQEQPNGNKLPAGYWSRILAVAERKYSTTGKKRLAAVCPMFTPRSYLYSTTFTLRTDHKALRRLLSLADVSGQMARWRLCPDEYV